MPLREKIQRCINLLQQNNDKEAKGDLKAQGFIARTSSAIYWAVSKQENKCVHEALKEVSRSGNIIL